jgi:hypothetical protein
MTVRLYRNGWKNIDTIQLHDFNSWRTVDAIWRYTDLYGWRQVYPNVAEPNITITSIEVTETTAIIGWVVEQSTSVLVEVFLQSNLSSPVFSILRNGASPNTQTVTGLIANTAYQVRLTATASNGIQTSVTQNFITTVQTPSAPTNVVASTGRVDGINVTWSTPANAGGSPITDYEIQRNQDPVAILTQTTWTSGLGVTNSYLADSVDPSPAQYYFRVRARNSFGPGTPSAVSNAGSKVAATDVELAANRTTINRNDFTLLTARIKNNGVNVNVPNIPLTFSIIGPGSFSSTSTVTSTTLFSNANGQASLNFFSSSTTGQAWIFVSTLGLNIGAVIINIVGSPTSAPTNLSGFSNSTGTAITFSWAAPLDNGGDPVNSYEFQRNQSATPGAEWVNVGNITQWTTSGLNPGTTYYIRVRAINDFGTSAYSEIIVTTATVPGAPLNLSAVSNASGTSVSLQWSAPSSNGGSAVTSYQLQRNQSATAGTEWVSLGLVTSWTSSNTNPGTLYYFRIRAVNDVGAGSFAVTSVTTNTTTTAPPPSTTAAPTPSPTTAAPKPPPTAAPPPPTPAPTSPPVKSRSLGPETKVLTRDYGFIEVKYLSVGDVLVSMDISEVTTFGADFDADNWSSETFTNNGTVYTEVTNIYARQVIGTMVRINGEWFTDNHNILVEKDGVYYFKQSIEIDNTYRVFDYDIMDWAPILDIYHESDVESIVYVVDAEPYDVFFTENALVYNRKEYFN